MTLHPDARNTAWVSFDGRHHQEINVGDRFVCLSLCPLHPLVLSLTLSLCLSLITVWPIFKDRLLIVFFIYFVKLCLPV